MERGTESKVSRLVDRDRRHPLLVYTYDPNACLFLAPHFVYGIPLDEFDTLMFVLSLCSVLSYYFLMTNMLLWNHVPSESDVL